MLLYPHFDPTPFPELQALITRERIQRPPAVPPPFACPPASIGSGIAVASPKSTRHPIQFSNSGRLKPNGIRSRATG